MGLRRTSAGGFGFVAQQGERVLEGFVRFDPQNNRLFIENGDTSTAAAAAADDLVIRSSGAAGLSILSPSTSSGLIFFGDEGSPLSGSITYAHTDDTLRLGAGAATRVTIGATSASFSVPVEIAPGSSVTPTDNGDMVFEATNDTTITVKLKGSDGTVRSGTISLS